MCRRSRTRQTGQTGPTITIRRFNYSASFLLFSLPFVFLFLLSHGSRSDLSNAHLGYDCLLPIDVLKVIVTRFEFRLTGSTDPCSVAQSHYIVVRTAA